MSNWRPARRAELDLLWPAARAAHVAVSFASFEALAKEAPWSIRISDAGDAMVLRRWRSHLGALSLRAAWAPAQRIGWLVDEARSVAAEQGFTSLLSPLTPESSLGPYADAGMETVQPLIALQGLAVRVAASAEGKRGAGSLREAAPEDLQALVALDAECFDDFWRYGSEELGSVIAAERVVVAEDDDRLIGYSSCSAVGSTATLGRLSVSPAYRRRGVGAQLVADAAAWGLRRHALGVSLCTQEDNRISRALYRRLGFVEVGERYVIASCPSGAQGDT